MCQVPPQVLREKIVNQTDTFLELKLRLWKFAESLKKNLVRIQVPGPQPRQAVKRCRVGRKGVGLGGEQAQSEQRLGRITSVKSTWQTPLAPPAPQIWGQKSHLGLHLFSAFLAA